MDFKKYILLFLVICLTPSLFPNSISQKISLSGYVKDVEDGEDLIGVTVYVKELNQGAVTNAYGYYAMNLPVGDYTIEYSYIGYETQPKKVTLRQGQTLNLELKSESKQLKEVEVRAERRDANVTRNAMSAQKIEIGAIRKIPALMGEVDLLKAIQLLPGVVSAGEGTSSFSVRGGGIDQNLIVRLKK